MSDQSNTWQVKCNAIKEKEVDHMADALNVLETAKAYDGLKCKSIGEFITLLKHCAENLKIKKSIDTSEKV